MRTYIITETQFDKLVSNNKEKGIEILSTLIRKRFPYITSIDISSITDDSVYINLNVDLNKFYKITNTTPPRDYFEKTGIDGEYFLLELLKTPGAFMMRYVDEKYKEDYSWEFNIKLEKLFSNYYKSLPGSVTYTKYEGYTGDDPFYIRWRDEKVPMDIKIDMIYPQVDVDKLLLTK
jgi:hypothetical protein